MKTITSSTYFLNYFFSFVYESTYRMKVYSASYSIDVKRRKIQFYRRTPIVIQPSHYGTFLSWGKRFPSLDSTKTRWLFRKIWFMVFLYLSTFFVIYFTIIQIVSLYKLRFYKFYFNHVFYQPGHHLLHLISEKIIFPFTKLGLQIFFGKFAKIEQKNNHIVPLP